MENKKILVEREVYEKDGNKVYTTDVMVERCEFAESKSAGSGQGSNSPSNTDTGFVNLADAIDDEQLPFA